MTRSDGATGNISDGRNENGVPLSRILYIIPLSVSFTCITTCSKS